MKHVRNDLPSSAPSSPSSSHGIRPGVALLVITVGAFLIRCRFIADVFLPQRLLPFDTDSSYHLWRIEEAVFARGLPPRFDRFMNAPYGANVIYPDGFDWLLSIFARLFCGNNATPFQIQVVSLLALPVLGALAVLVVYAFARVVSSTKASLIAAFWAAILPSCISSSILGRVDHHVFELALPPLILAVLLPVKTGDPLRRWWRRAAMAGVLLATLTYMVPATLLYWGVISFSLVVAALKSSHDKEQGSGLLKAFALSCLIAFVLVMPDAITRSDLVYYRPSWLQPIAFVAGAAGCLVLVFLDRWGFRAQLWSTLGMAMVALAALFSFAKGALSFVGRSGIISLVNESRPVWTDLWTALQGNSLIFPLLPLFFIPLFLRKTPAAWSIGTMGLCGFLLVSMQERFSVVLAAPAAVGVAVSWEWLWHRLGQRGKWGKWGKLALCVLGLVALGPPVDYLIKSSLLSSKHIALLEAAEWFRLHTPFTGAHRGHESPPYTVLAMWDEGNIIAYLGERPVLAGAMYHGDYGVGAFDAITLLFGDSAPEPLLNRRRVKYLVVTERSPNIEAAHRALLHLSPIGVKPTLHRHLFHHDGKALVSGEGAKRLIIPARDDLRLVHESLFTTLKNGQSAPSLKIFERVVGALLLGTCSNNIVRAKIPIQSNAGRTFDFISAVPCQDGRFQLRLPYPGSYRLTVKEGNVITSPEILEEEIRSGSIRSIDES